MRVHSGTTAQWNQGFSYDELGGLSSFVEHQGSAMTTANYSHSYTYDRYGNRFQASNSTLGLQAVIRDCRHHESVHYYGFN